MLSVGEVNKNKNHRTIIDALAKIMDAPIYYVICGTGLLMKELIEYAQSKNVGGKVIFAGFCENVEDYYKMADIFAFPSLREGLGLAAIEAMISELPLVTSNIHGINDYSVDGITGYKCDRWDAEGFGKAIQKLQREPFLRMEIGKKNREAAEKYSIEAVTEAMCDIYKRSGV